MPMVTLRSVLTSFASAAALIGAPGFAFAQDVPAADPAAISGQEEPAPDAPGGDAVPAPAITVVPLVETPAEPAITPIPAVWAPAPKDAEGRTAYGLYLSGRYLAGHAASGGEGDGAEGAHQLAAVQSLIPEQPVVREQAFTAALLSGDLDDAARMAPSGSGVSPVLGEAGKLVAVVQAYAHGDAKGAFARLQADPVRAPHARAAVLVQPWIAAAADQWDLALIAPAQGSSDILSQVLRYQRAQLLEIHRQPIEAEAEYKALAGSAAAAATGGQPAFRTGYGAFLERRGRRDEALALYDAAIAAGATDPQTAAARARAVAGRPAPVLPTLREGAGGALLLAAALVANDSTEFSAVYIRLSLNVSPSDEARLLLGGALAKARMESAARDALAQVSPTDPTAYAAARMQIAGGLVRQDRHEEALGEFRKAAEAAPANPQVAFFLASQLVQLKREDEALALLNGPVLNTADQAAEVHFLRGAAYEAQKKVPQAEAELWAALQAQPDEPSFLNYLGYLWVDSGTRVAEGAAMIARAHAADPTDGNIQDSLGWAQFRQGQYEEAVANLEEAVTREPANAEINDHLGDAYWQVGRKREAGFQWTRVLTLEPDAERRAEVEKKLADGLDPTALPGGA